jgi:catechol 2,3-dioxygenase-like lactoylglutathione lyase family enzyme
MRDDVRPIGMRASFRAQEEQVMRRFHVHLGVPDLAASIRFYSDLFGMPPSVEKPDYAKWMLDDPRVNFAISHRSSRIGLNHLGLQAESADELAAIRTQFAAADSEKVVDEPNVNCCYARGNKHWTKDPQGIAWEAFHTLDSVPVYGGADEPAAATACGSAATPCCGPAEETAKTPRTKNACCA